ncbi:MAG: ChaN family lipoprotein [Candidatus Brocadiia bacterium]
MKKIVYLLGWFLICVTLVTFISAETPVTPKVAEAPKVIEIKDIKNIPPAELIGKIYDLRNKKFVSFDEMMDDAAKANVVYVGETHDSVPHHQMQEKVLKAVYERNSKTRKISIGMEMFQRPYQSFLDDYIAKKIDEKEMLRKTDYYSRWSFEWMMYQPMVTFSYEKGLKVVALNAPAEISKKVARSGLKVLTPEERKSLPEKIDINDKEHRFYIYERFRPHIQMGMFTEENFQSFYESQCVWEDTMADSVASFFRGLDKDAASGQMVVFVGGGHIMFRFGIPERAKWRTQFDYRTILGVEISENKEPMNKSEDGNSGVLEILEEHKNSPADYLFFTKVLKIDQIRPMLGVILDQPLADKKGMPVKDIAPNSAASKAGIQKDDIIIFVDNQPIADMLDLKFAMLNKKENDKVEVTVVRGKDTKKLALTLELVKRD